MKKVLAVLLCAVLFITAMAVSPGIALAAAATPVPESMLGQPFGGYATVLKGYTRVDASEYGFQWYIFNKDYKKFMMVGVDNDTVVAVYTDSPSLLAANSINTKQTRDQLRQLLGEPVQYRMAGNTVYMMQNADEKDVFDNGDYCTTVFYDKYNKMKVASVLTVKATYEEQLIGKNVEMGDALIAAYTRESFDLVNSARAIRKISVLKWDGSLAKLAIYRSTDMRDRDYFSHYSPDGASPADYAKQMGIRYKKLGENISCGYKNAISAHEGFMNSKGHRDNVLYKSYKYLGTGVAYGGSRYINLTCNYKR
ncbi:MAG: CAP-associated domain-containing protein [Bacillota bacterium]|nr:CAP-associated domain-containing protein [Bacillota bacterium]